MSARRELLQDLPNQPEKVAGQVLMYLHSLPGYVAPEKPAPPDAVDYWESHWSKVSGSCEEMEWDEPEEQEFEVREEVSVDALTDPGSLPPVTTIAFSKNDARLPSECPAGTHEPADFRSVIAQAFEALARHIQAAGLANKATMDETTPGAGTANSSAKSPNAVDAEVGAITQPQLDKERKHNLLAPGTKNAIFQPLAPNTVVNISAVVHKN